MVKHGHGCCSECDSHLEKQFLGGKLNYNKFGGAFWDDVGNYVFGALHRVGDVIQGVIPGTIGKAIAFAPKSASKNQGVEEGNEVEVQVLKLDSILSISACGNIYKVL